MRAILVHLTRGRRVKVLSLMHALLGGGAMVEINETRTQLVSWWRCGSSSRNTDHVDSTCFLVQMSLVPVQGLYEVF
jgi:hypothetical protein